VVLSGLWLVPDNFAGIVWQSRRPLGVVVCPWYSGVERISRLQSVFSVGRYWFAVRAQPTLAQPGRARVGASSAAADTASRVDACLFHRSIGVALPALPSPQVFT